MNRAVGTIRKVPIKEVWPNEERDFTPWLKEQGLKDLLPLIGIDEFQDAEPESRCGDGGRSEADLVVTYLDDEDEKKIVIENQYGKCDSDHLGRLLMYAADIEASEVVWITEEERPEYIKTINWLNDTCSTASDVGFYLVRVSSVAIGDSLPAPVFTVLARPEEEEVRAVKEEKRTAAMDLCLDFWKSCTEDEAYGRLLASAGLHQRKAKGDRWKDYSVGSSDVTLCASVTTEGGRIKTSITVKNDSEAYKRLMNDDAIARLEKHIGLHPERGRKNTKKYTTINFYAAIDIADGIEQQAAARKWFGEMLPRMKSFLEVEKIIKKG